VEQGRPQAHISVVTAALPLELINISSKYGFTMRFATS
jgi:hypothetical protein